MTTQTAIPVAPIATQAQPAAPVLAGGLLAGLSKWMNASGEIDFSKIEFGNRINAYLDFEKEATKTANLVNFDVNIFAQLAEGTTFVAVPMIPKANDIWDDKAAAAIGCKEGETEIKADFVISLAQRLGVTLKKVYEGPREIDKVMHYSVRYNAFLTTGDGLVLMAEEIGKDVPMYNSKGMQAHIVESTQKKAQRNAICSLLNIKKVGPKDDFLKPWIMLRPVFRDAGILAEQAQIANRAKALLFDAGHPVVDVQAEPESPESEATALTNELAAISSIDELKAFGLKVNAANLTEAEMAKLRTEYKERGEALAQLAQAS